MTNKHPGDFEIQEYVLQKSNCDAEIIVHIEQCANCKIKAAEYTLLLEEIKCQEKPVFDFKLQDLVMAQLHKSQHNASTEKSFYYFIAFLCVSIVSVVFYFFGNNLLRLFGGAKPILISLIITTVLCLFVFLCIDMYRKYHAHMKALNFY